MDERTCFMNEILADMQTGLEPEKLEMLKSVLVKRLEYIDIISRTHLMCISNTDVNEKYFRLFIASKRLQGASEKTIFQYVYETKKLLTRLDKKLTDITTMDVQFYLSDYERCHNVCRRSIDNMRRAISGMFLWLVDNSYIASNPMSAIKPIAYEKKRIEILTDNEIYDIREASRVNLRTRAIVEVLLATGVRVSELCALNIDDLDFDKCEIIINSAKKRHKEKRILYLTVEASRCLKSYMEYRSLLTSPDGNVLFMSNRNGGRRITERLVNTTLRDIEKKIGLKKKLTVHTFRRTLASILYKRGMQPLDIAHILGHADTRMSETYYIGIQEDEIKKNYYKYR